MFPKSKELANIPQICQPTLNCEPRLFKQHAGNVSSYRFCTCRYRIYMCVRCRCLQHRVLYGGVALSEYGSACRRDSFHRLAYLERLRAHRQWSTGRLYTRVSYITNTCQYGTKVPLKRWRLCTLDGMAHHWCETRHAEALFFSSIIITFNSAPDSIKPRDIDKKQEVPLQEGSLSRFTIGGQLPSSYMNY